ncbi:MAG TPA: DedA family protein [Alphaproteobacteria bacterium]
MQHIHQLVNDYGAWIYALIFLWTFFEGETFVLFAGLAASKGYLDLGGVFFAAWLGSFAGDQLYFWIGRRWGTALLLRVPRWRPSVERALDWLRRYDTGFILSFRFVYGIRNFASFAMGMSGLAPARFASLNLAAAFVWAASFTGFGFLFGHVFKHMLGDVAQIFSFVMLGVFIAGFTVAGILSRRHRRRSPMRTAVPPTPAPAPTTTE